MKETPFQHKKILITKPGDSTVFANQIKHLGGIPIVFPLIGLKAFQQELLTTTLSNNQFDWIVFTSPQAVRFFFDQNTIPQNKVKIAAVGSATQKVLIAKNVEVDFVPTKFTAKQLAVELPITPNQHIFIPRSDLAKNDIVDVLEQRNCRVTTRSIYQNKPILYTLKEIENINNQKIDFVVFTSGSAVQSYSENRIVLKNTKVICIGPETAKIAAENNIDVVAIANPHTIDGVLDAIKKSSTN